MLTTAAVVIEPGLCHIAKGFDLVALGLRFPVVGYLRHEFGGEYSVWVFVAGDVRVGLDAGAARGRCVC